MTTREEEKKTQRLGQKQAKGEKKYEIEVYIAKKRTLEERNSFESISL